MRKIACLLAAAALLPAAPLGAETFTGTITTVDQAGGRILLTRADTERSIAVAIHSPALLERLHPGTIVRLDADRGSAGVWQARTLSTSGIRFRAPDDDGRELLAASARPVPLEQRLRDAGILPGAARPSDGVI